MSYCPPIRAAKNCATGGRSFSHAGLAVLLLSLPWFTGCAGYSVPVSGSTPPASNSTSSLTIPGGLPSAIVGTSYDATLSVTGGVAPYRFSIVSGQLPSGVNLADNTGTFSGTPAAAGNFSFAVSVSDSTGLSKQASLQLVVASSTSSNGSQSKSFS